jgi:hypothetical protein
MRESTGLARSKKEEERTKRVTRGRDFMMVVEGEAVEGTTAGGRFS